MRKLKKKREMTTSTNPRFQARNNPESFHCSFFFFWNYLLHSILKVSHYNCLTEYLSERAGETCTKIYYLKNLENFLILCNIFSSLVIILCFKILSLFVFFCRLSESEEEQQKIVFENLENLRKLYNNDSFFRVPAREDCCLQLNIRVWWKESELEAWRSWGCI